MRSGSWFSETPRSIRDALFADRVILALANAQRNRGPIPADATAGQENLAPGPRTCPEILFQRS
jgi:hypothetical protein